MKQVVQPMTGGPVQVVDVPSPSIGPTDVLVRTAATVISPGTERTLTRLGRSSLIAKARARPDLVRQVIAKSRRDGVRATLDATRARLGGDLALGYSGAGVVVDAGDAVEHLTAGDRVATGGAGRANHAELQSVPGLLCARVPDGVPLDSAAFATIGSIALHGLRLADVGTGGNVVVIGLGLIGQLALRIAGAAGCRVAGIDVGSSQVELARRVGFDAWVEAGDETTRSIYGWSRGRGADAVLVCAGGSSSAVMARVPALCRDRASVVVVGDVGVQLDRRTYYERELTVRFSRSYGPGRYEQTYEDWGVDYPPGFVRWTEGRNLEAVLDLLASNRIEVDDLVTRRYPVEDAAAAYALVESAPEPVLAVVLEYAGAVERGAKITTAPARPSSGLLGIGLIGAGAFAQSTLMPALRRGGLDDFVAIATASGTTAASIGRRAGFRRAVPSADDVIADPDVDVVVIASRHDSHAALAERALRAGKHVFCEKPLALSFDELELVEDAWLASGRVLFVGFNRRWSPAVATARRALTGVSPLGITYRISAGEVPSDHWYHDRRHGGRLVGEVCHFVDTAASLVGSPAVEHFAFGSGHPVANLDEDVAIGMRYDDGSVATILYAIGGHRSMRKERVEVIGGGRTVTIDDFREVTVDGRRQRGDSGKGFDEEVRAFVDEVRGGPPSGGWAVSSMRTTLELAADLNRPRTQ